MTLSAEDQKFLDIAISEAQAGFDEGGVPIGACLVSKDGKLIAKGRNLRMQKLLRQDQILIAGVLQPCMAKRGVWKMQDDFPPARTKVLQW
jgi:hypothetical protein